MCGIAGYIGKKKLKLNVLKNALKSMQSRGPDNSNYVYYKIKNKYYYLLHTRLSIIDLKKRSSQPFKYKNYVIIFNGEIYNYIEIKKKFFNKSKLKTSSDTEILIRLYSKFKEKCLDYLEGMWSFAILNLKNGEVFFSRDRMGEKPLFYEKTKNDLIFGSETKFIQKLTNKKYHANIQKCKTFFYYGYNFIFNDHKSFIKNIYTLPPSNYFIYKGKKIIKKKYWDLSKIKQIKISEKNAIKKIKDLLISSVKLRVRSDVNNSFFLSGGVDSGSVVSIAKKKLNQSITSFSVSDSKSKYYNEKFLYKKVAKDVSAKKYEIEVYKLNFFDNLKSSIKYFNSPVLTINSLLQERLFNKIKKLGFKTSIGGSGSDEIFAGYYDHPKFFLTDLKSQNHESYVKNLKDFEKYFFNKIRNPKIRDLKIKKNYYSRINNLNLDFFGKIKIPKLNLEKKKYPFKSFLKNALYFQFKENLYPALYQEDLNAMKNSVENRNPFLDKSLIEFLFSLNSKLFLKNGFSKYLLRASMNKILIDDIRLNREKFGFNASFENFKDFNLIKLLKYFKKNKKIIQKLINYNKIIIKYKQLKLKVFSRDSEIQKITFRLISTVEFIRNIQNAKLYKN